MRYFDTHTQTKEREKIEEENEYLKNKKKSAFIYTFSDKGRSSLQPAEENLVHIAFDKGICNKQPSKGTNNLFRCVLIKCQSRRVFFLFLVSTAQK